MANWWTEKNTEGSLHCYMKELVNGAYRYSEKFPLLLLYCSLYNSCFTLCRSFSTVFAEMHVQITWFRMVLMMQSISFSCN